MADLVKKTIESLVPPRVIWAWRYWRYPQYFEITGGPLRYNQDGLATKHGAGFLADPDFVDAYRLGQSTGSWEGTWGRVDPAWRVYVVCWAAAKGCALEGDWVECGVNKGGFARAAMRYIGFERMAGRKFYLLDTFSGTPPHCLAEGEARRNVYPECYEDVQRNFAGIPNVEIVRGEVPGTLSQVPSRRVCFLSLDMNCAEPEIAAAEFFWDKLSPGAVIVLDDYGHVGHEMQKRGFDGFAARRGVRVLDLPTAQGLIFKP